MSSIVTDSGALRKKAEHPITSIDEARALLLKPRIVTDLGILRTKSEPVTSVDEAKALIARIEAELLPLEHGVGLAAIQLGFPKAVGVIKDTHNHGLRSGKLIYLINPEVIEAEDEFINTDEGCLSCPNLFKATKRFDTFVIKNHVIEGDEFREEIQSYYVGRNGGTGTDGLTAIAVQHEIDHFNGKLITDYDVVVEPIRRTESKVGRNDPCPCGSGKKYKKCCLDKG
jgi:peptide deformylase